MFWDALRHLVLPGLALALPGLAQLARLTRTNMVDSYARPFVEFARAYGVSEWRIAGKYALRPASIPVLTILGMQVVALLGSAFLIEVRVHVAGHGALRRAGYPAEGPQRHHCGGDADLGVFRRIQHVGRRGGGPDRSADPSSRAAHERNTRATLAILAAIPSQHLVPGWAGAGHRCRRCRNARAIDRAVPTPRRRFYRFSPWRPPPNGTYWLGTDTIGRDVLSRILFGFRTSLMLGCVVLAIAVPLGTLAGLVAGYSGGAIDNIIMRITDIFLSIPSLVLAMTILGLFLPSQVLAMVAVSAVWWPWYARLVYGLVRSIRLQGFVVAAEVIGASRWRILLAKSCPIARQPF